jgi:Xaa-Pro aminopeptidase
MDEAAITMEDLINRTNFSKNYYEKAARKALEFRGHLSHTVGMDVHDRGDYRSQPLITGTVFSVDPMMWIPEEKLYIRVEDTVIVTENGMENLTQLAPLELDDVEMVMKEKGILENHHLIKYLE